MFFPKGVHRVEDQVSWALQQITEKGKESLEEAEHASAAQALDSALVQTSLKAIGAHLDQEGDLRAKAVRENLIAA